MGDTAYISSHPTGVPTGISELAPVIVNQSPELPSRRGFDSNQYEEEYPTTGQLYDQKHSATIGSYSGIHSLGYRARDRESMSHAQVPAYYGSAPGNFAAAAGNASFDLKTSHAGSYTTTNGTSPADYPQMSQYSRITSWQPQQGPPGTELRINLVTNVKLDVNRHITARFARDDCQAVYSGGHELIAPFTYLVTAQAPAQATTQWSITRAIPVYLFLPFEGMSSQPQHVGTFTYTDTSAAASPSDSELEQSRRTSEVTYYKQDAESPHHGHEASLAQLPPMKASRSASTGYYAPSIYSSSGSEEYATQASASSYYTPSLVSSYTQTPGCTPPTPSWTGTAVSASNPLAVSTNGMYATPRPMNGGMSVAATVAEPEFIRVQPKNGELPSLGGQGSMYGRYPNNKATLVMKGDPMDMAQNWSARETNDNRRLVAWSRQQIGGEVHTSFEAVHPDDGPFSMPVVSCIWWEREQDYYVTSVDTIGLLEKLVVPGKQFSVEEKNRIRRNLEGFGPVTVKKDDSKTVDFFKVIMNFPAPRPRHIEKDVKVFKWSRLGQAMKKIINKYEITYATTAGMKRGAGEISLTPGGSEAPSKLQKSFDQRFSHHQQAQAYQQLAQHSVPLSSASSTFSDSYAQAYSSYSQPQTPSYSTYPQHQQYTAGVGEAGMGMPNSSHLMLHQQRPSVGYAPYMGGSHAAYLS